jgi:hypothetical protein
MMLLGLSLLTSIAQGQLDRSAVLRKQKEKADAVT